MAATIFSNPSGTFLPANQRLIFGFSTTTTVTNAFRFVVVVKENGTTIGTYYLAPNANEKAFFDLGEIAKKRVQADQTPYTSTASILFGYTSTPFTRSIGNIAQYTVEVGEWDGTTLTTNQDNLSLYLIGGREQLAAGLHPDFSEYYASGPTRKAWLTDHPVTGSYIELTARDEDQGYTALITRSLVSSATAVTYSVTTSSGTTATNVTLNTTNGAQLPTATSPVGGFLTYVALMPVNVEAITGVDLTDWISYTVTPIIEATLQPVGRAIRVTRNCKTYKTDPVQIAWTNSKGGWDYANFEGKLLTTLTTQAKPYRKALGDWNGATFTAPGFLAETEYFHKDGEDKYELTGYFTPAEAEVLRNLVLAKRAFIRLSDWVPVLVEPTSYAVRTHTAQMSLVTVTVKLAQTLVS
jgi:hypothetical protein